MLLKALGVCAGGYAPGVKRPEGRPRGPTDAFGYAQGYALTMTRHARPFLDFRRHPQGSPNPKNKNKQRNMTKTKNTK